MNTKKLPGKTQQPLGDKLKNMTTSYIRVGVYSLLVNIFLVLVKLIMASVTGSLALRADAIHSSVDIFGSLALITGLLIANRKSSKFPYGLYKIENVMAIVISIILFITAYEIFRQSITGNTSTASYQGWALVVVGSLAAVPFLFSRYEIKMGKRYNSPSLIADGKQFRADILSSSVVFFALLSDYLGFPVDRWAAGIIALFIAYAGWDLLYSSMKVLLDASVDRKTIEDIRSVIEKEPAVSSVEQLTGRNSGRYMFVEATIKLKTTDLEEAHQITERLESGIKKRQCCIDRVMIHYEPADEV
jgi:cation diffusion facilitator family transporter